MDPRVRTPLAGLRQQFDLAQRIVAAWRKDSLALAEVRVMRARLDTLMKAAGTGARGDSLAALDAKLAALAGAGGGRLGGGARGAAAAGPTLASLNGQLGGLFGAVEGTDATPRVEATRAVADAEHALTRLLARWRDLKDGAGAER
jgi:hypothetical protein